MLESTLETAAAPIIAANDAALTETNVSERPTATATASAIACFHCGSPVGKNVFTSDNKNFCCRGCQTVFELLTENGLTDFYQLSPASGIRVKPMPGESEFSYLDTEAVRQRLVDYADDRTTRVTFHVPEIHCIACVWLLENLFRLKSGIGHSRVNFPRREIGITFETPRVKLSEVVILLTSLGYAPELKLAALENRAGHPVSRRLWLQLGVAGFAFGNIMLLSIASYFGLDNFSGPLLKKLFGYLSFALAMPVIFYSASDYWRAAWLAARRKMLTIEVPIAAGIAALAARSTYEVFGGHGEGYFDSLAGLLFFLLCGKLFQQRTYDRLTFDRDYKSFFPLAITRRRDGIEARVALSQLEVGDELVIRNGELIPCDSELLGGQAVIDYSFVTGEAEPATKNPGDYLYAGGRQMGSAITVKTLKAVSQSYLTSLWNQQAFQKEKNEALDSLTNRYSRRFTRIVISVAVGAALFWWFVNPGNALASFTAVLIVACPCALALAAPFTLGTAQRLLARRKVYLKNSATIETLATINAIVFDKTGTLTTAGLGNVIFHGQPLTADENRRVHALAQHSTHPNAIRIAEVCGNHHPSSVSHDDIYPGPNAHGFTERAGYGIKAIVEDREVVMGSATWLMLNHVRVDAPTPPNGSVVHLAVDGVHRGCFTLENSLRPDIERLLKALAGKYDLALLSGDNERERARFTALFGESQPLHFNQSPLNKLGFIQNLQSHGKTVLMVGDGLNDAGALQQSDVGVAVVENVSAFSPACDVIMDANMVPRLHQVLRFSKASVRVVRLSFFISSLYNVVGISLAARGLLSPIICAILMPVSSVTVMAFACGLTNWFGRKILPQSADSTPGAPEDPS